MENQSPHVVDASFAALIAALKEAALQTDGADFDRVAGYIRKVGDLRTRFADGRAVNDPRGGKAGAQ